MPARQGGRAAAAASPRLQGCADGQGCEEAKKKSGRTSSRAGKGGAVPEAEVAGNGALPAKQVTPDSKLSGKAAKKADEEAQEGGQGPRRQGRASPSRGRTLLRVGPGFSLADLDPALDAGLPRRQGRRRGRHGRARSRGSATSRNGSTRSPRAAGSARCCSSSRAWTPRARAGSCATSSARSTRRASTSPRSRRRAREERRHPFLWRIRTRPAAPRHDRRLRPQPLRGRPHRARPRPRAPHDVVAPLRPDQRLRAGRRRRRHDRRQGDAAHLERGAEGPAHRAARARGQALEVQPGRPRRARALGRLHGRRTRRSSRSARRMPRRGSSCPPTASGTPGSR